jgi:hypothetical protein
MSASNSSLYEEITIESNNQERTIDLRLGTISVDYYEDIFSPTITAKIRVVNNGDTIKNEKDGKFQSIYNGLPLRGGERVSMKILDQGLTGKNAPKKGLDFSSSENYLYVSSITDVLSDSLLSNLLFSFLFFCSCSASFTRLLDKKVNCFSKILTLFSNLTTSIPPVCGCAEESLAEEDFTIAPCLAKILEELTLVFLNSIFLCDAERYCPVAGLIPLCSILCLVALSIY